MSEIRIVKRTNPSFTVSSTDPFRIGSKPAPGARPTPRRIEVNSQASGVRMSAPAKVHAMGKPAAHASIAAPGGARPVVGMGAPAPTKAPAQVQADAIASRQVGLVVSPAEAALATVVLGGFLVNAARATPIAGDVLIMLHTMLDRLSAAAGPELLAAAARELAPTSAAPPTPAPASQMSEILIEMGETPSAPPVSPPVSPSNTDAK